MGKSGIIWGRSSDKETIHAVETPLLICSKVVSSIGKVMASVFLDAKSIVFTIFKKATPSMESTMPTFWGSYKRLSIPNAQLMKGVFFHQDNTPAHKSLVSMTAVCDCDFQLVDHPSYSLDLAQSASHLNMKKILGWEPVSQWWWWHLLLMTFFDQQNESFVTNGIQAPQHWQKKCVDCKGDYVDK